MLPSCSNGRVVFRVEDMPVEVRQQNDPSATWLHPSRRMDLMGDKRCPDGHVLHIAPDDGSLESDSPGVFVAQQHQAVLELVVDDAAFEDDGLAAEFPVFDVAHGLAVVLGTEGEEGAEEEDELLVALESEATPESLAALGCVHTEEFEEWAFSFDVKAGKINGTILLLRFWPDLLAKDTCSAIAEADIKRDQHVSVFERSVKVSE